MHQFGSVCVSHLVVCVVALNQFFSSTSREDAALYSSASLQEETSLWSHPQRDMKRRRMAPQGHTFWHLYRCLPSQIHPVFRCWTYSYMAGGLWLSSSEVRTDTSLCRAAEECRRSCEHKASCSNDQRLVLWSGAPWLFGHGEGLKWVKPECQEPETHSCSTSAPGGS